MTSLMPTRVLTPVLTPVDAGLSPDTELLVEHCRRLAEKGSGLAVFGTTSEANSFSISDKRAALDALVAAGIDPSLMMPGTGACALADAVEMTRHAVSLGCGGVLMLPPFYYKEPSNEGLLRFFAEAIERVGDDRLRVYLYHIPPVAKVGFPHEVIAALIERFPGIVVGLKDSSGDFDHTSSLIKTFPGFGVYCGNEIYLAKAMALGGAGCISATCNINVDDIVALAESWDTPGAAALQERVNVVRTTVSAFPVIPALKAVVARHYGAENFAAPLPPLMPLGAAEREKLFAALDTLDYAMKPA